MIPFPKPSRIVPALAAALALLHCESSPGRVVDGGGGSEAVALTGRVRGPGHVPAADALVRLRPRLFLRDTLPGSPGSGPVVYDAKTGEDGAFRIDSLAAGEYVVEIADGEGNGWASAFTVTGLQADLTLQDAVLEPTGSVTGAFLPPEGISGRAWVQVYGLERVAAADPASGRFELEGLPRGSYTLRALFSARAVDPLDIGAVPAGSLDTTDIGTIRLGSFELEDYADWPYSLRIGINTTDSGAGVAGMVTDFPLLVRLDSSNFDFSKARGDGRDIRFSDSRGQRLRYGIERWDSAGARAEVWVRADVVRGGSRDQHITLHSGRPEAMAWSDGRAVFERDYGFAGVWHFAEDGSAGLEGRFYTDAAGINPANDQASSPDRQGVAGHGAGFDGDDLVQVPVADPVLKPTGRLSVSAWFKATETDRFGGAILSMGDNYNLRLTAEGWARFSLHDGATRAAEDRSRSLLDGAWHHIAGVFDGNALVLYVDGAERARLATRDPILYNLSPHFIIGRHGDGKPGFGFKGSLDEITVASEVRGPDWIKLAYESQRPGSRLLEFPR